MSVAEIADELYPEVTGFREFLAITDVASRVEYLHQRARLAVVNLEEVAEARTAGISLCHSISQAYGLLFTVSHAFH